MVSLPDLKHKSNMDFDYTTKSYSKAKEGVKKDSEKIKI